MSKAAPRHPRSFKSVFKSALLLFLLFLFKSQAEWTKSNENNVHMRDVH